MQNLIFSLNATLPVFLVMVVGYALGQLGFLPPAFCKASDRLTFKVTLPLMLFLDMGSVDILHDFRPRFVLFCFAATLVGILTVWAGAKRFLKDKTLVGEFVQAGYRSSAAVLGVAFIQNIYGSAGMAPLMILGSVPLFNIFAVLILMLESPEQRGVPDPKQLLRGVATNPILLGIVFGTVYALLPFTLPQIATKTISSIASLTTPLSLLSIGASFEGTKAIKKLGPTLAAAFIKTVGLAAVFLPSLLLPGITGTLFQQFAVTIAISMLISAFNALTLSPALSAILLKPKDPSKGGPLKFFYRVFNRSYDATASGYTKVCHFLTRKLIISIPLLALIAYAIVPVAKKIPNGFLPDEDQGYLFAALIMPEARSLQLTTAAADKVSELIRQNPNVKDVIAISGFSLLTGVQSTNNAFFFVMLKPWEERPNPDQSAQAVTAQLNALLTTKVSEGITMCFQPPAIAGVGSANGVTFMLEDRDGKGTEYLAEQTDIFVKEANKLPIFDPNNNGGVRSVMSFAVEQKDVRLDEEKCATLGVSISEANSLLQAYMGSLFINYITLYGQQWQVYIQAQGSDRTGTDMLKNFYVKNNTGSSVPLSTLVKITDIKGPEFLLRQNLYNSSKLMVTPAQGYSNSQAMEALEKTFEASMPSDMGYSYADMSYQEQKIQNGIGIVQIFLLSSVFVFLILAALYERWSLPLSIFMTVPIAALGAFLGLYWFGYELNLYAQIGLVMLIGLAAKNAILIVEFAVIEMERGKTLMEATLSAARIRLRPILMTSFAFILGCVPLALASGSGAYSRNIIGIVVIAGMTMATVVGIFLIPCSFYFIMKLFRVRIARKTVETEDPDEIIARKHLFHEAHESLKG